MEDKNMKTTLKYGISAYSGTIDDITFASYKNGAVCIARKYVVPKPTAQNETLAANARNLVQIYRASSEGFKNDLRTYADMYNKQKSRRKKLPVNPYGLFTKMMYAFQKENEGSVGLDSITYNDIKTLFTDLNSVASAVDSGYLPAVTGSALLTAEI